MSSVTLNHQRDRHHLQDARTPTNIHHPQKRRDCRRTNDYHVRHEPAIHGQRSECAGPPTGGKCRKLHASHIRTNRPQLPHVHLVSSFRLPIHASIQPAQALDYLIKGPSIVKDAASVAWTFLQAPPPDGTLLLTWQAPRMGTNFASDGLVWGDSETVFDIPVKGFVRSLAPACATPTNSL
jgi:hypothetical protein